MSKKILILFLLCFSLLFAGCKENTSVEESGSNEVKTEGETVQDEQQAVNTIAELAGMSSLEVVNIMGNGINLGNTMESGARSTLGTDSAISSYETGWGMPITTSEMIAGMKAAGFDTIRIPVAWTCAINYEQDDYSIREEFIERIAQIVDYALEADMFVIINDHWDNQWWGMFGDADEKVNLQAMTLYKKMWEGIATYFAGYDERLIFESANEELGNRLNDNWKDFSGEQTGVLSVDECYELTNTINQTFVDTVRATGGNNDHRFLLIAGYNTDITMTVDSRYVMPKDTAENKLLLSVHYYDPSNYCIFKSTDKWGVKADYVGMNEMLAKLTKFTDAGYGVVIGEYGVLHDGKATTLRDNTVLYTENFLNNCNIYGYVPVLWDCNSVYDRDICKMSNVEIGRLFTKYSYEYEKDADKAQVVEKAKKYVEKMESEATDVVIAEGTAWLMFNSSDWGISYAVGDDHPSGGTDGIVVTEPVITGEGTYTVGLDFTGTGAKSANSTVFAAIGILNGETLFPGYRIVVKEVLVNGEPYAFEGENYTTTDDGLCTRTNLYNGWISDIPAEARLNGDKSATPATGILNPDTLGQVETLEVTFSFEK